jgi:hypothetical protein
MLGHLFLDVLFLVGICSKSGYSAMLFGYIENSLDIVPFFLDKMQQSLDIPLSCLDMQPWGQAAKKLFFHLLFDPRNVFFQ